MRVLTLGIGIALLLAGAPSAAREAGGGGARPELRGVVTPRSVGPLRFGATMAAVRDWAGAPSFTSPPSRSLFVPRHGPDTTVFVYHCEDDGVHGCHTLFAFANGRLTTFSTNSPLFRTTTGVRPGMGAAEVARRDPGLYVSATCPSWQGKRIPALLVSAPRGNVFTLYARTSARPAVFPPSC